MKFRQESPTEPRYLRRIFDPSIQPRLVFVLLLGAVLGGSWLVSNSTSLLVILSHWVLVVTFAILLGGLYWRVSILEQETRPSEIYVFLATRWGRIETVAVAGFVTSGGIFLSRGNLSAVYWKAVLSGMLITLVGLRGLNHVLHSKSDTSRKPWFRYGMLLAVIIAGVCIAQGDTTGRSPVRLVVRLVHLFGIGVWLGAATWHNFCIYPAVRQWPDARRELRTQAKRFRRYLPTVILLIFGSGLLQTYWRFETVPALITSIPGAVVTLKIVILVALSGFVLRTLLGQPD